MHTFLHEKFKLSLIKLLKEHEGSLIAISGGQDSLCLIQLINDCFKHHPYKFEAIYIDHQWKNDSLKHSKHIINIAKQVDIPISIYQVKHLVFSEAEAREIRYKILIQHAIQNNFKTILTGHNQNDQIETFLQHLFRSSSIDGVTGLVNKRKINQQLEIIRPLLIFNREEIAWFCRKLYLPVWSDTTNYNYKIQRNRLRYEFVPYLQTYFNPNISQAIYSFLNLCINDNEYLKENAIKLYIKSKHNKLIGLNLMILQHQHYALQARILQMYFHYHFNKSMQRKYIKKIITMIKKDKTLDSIMYSNDLIIQKNDGWLYTNFNR